MLHHFINFDLFSFFLFFLFLQGCFDIDGKIIFKLVLVRYQGHGLDYFSSEEGQVAGCCEGGRRHSV